MLIVFNSAGDILKEEKFSHKIWKCVDLGSTILIISDDKSFILYHKSILMLNPSLNEEIEPQLSENNQI